MSHYTMHHKYGKKSKLFIFWFWSSLLVSFLVKRLFHSRLLDIRWLASSYPRHARGKLLNRTCARDFYANGSKLNLNLLHRHFVNNCYTLSQYNRWYTSSEVGIRDPRLVYLYQYQVEMGVTYGATLQTQSYLQQITESMTCFWKQFVTVSHTSI